VQQGRGGVGELSARAASLLAWTMWTLSIALTALSLCLLVLGLSYPDVPVYYFWAEGVLVAIGFSTVGAVIVSRMPPENPVGWLLCATGFLWAAHHFAAEYAIYALLAAPRSLPGGQAAAWTYPWLAYLSLGLILFVFLLFPDGRVPGSRWRWFARLSALFTAVAMVLAAFSYGPIAVGLPYIHNPLGIEGLPNAYKLLLVLMIALGAAAATSLLVRWVYARGIERQQIKWFAYATAVGVSGAILQHVISEPLEVMWLGWVGRALVLAGLVGMPVSIGIAILRYRLYHIDLVINRTLVYGTLTATLVAVYFGAVVVLQGIGSVVLQVPFRALTGQESQLATVAATLATAALFNPLRRRIQDFIDKRFYRRKYDATKTLEAFSAKLRDETDLDALSDDLVGVVRETMQPAHVSLWLRPDQPPRGSERE
jgi:hypothetical protein